MEQQVYFIILKYMILFLTHFILQASTEALNCTFDADFCDWTSDKDGDFDWKRDNGSSFGTQTGPKSDHTKNGYFIYMDATNQIEGKKAKIKSPMQAPGPHCLTFWYSMHGRDLGALNIYMYLKNVTGGKSIIFTQDRPIGSPPWQKTVISRNVNVKFQVVIEGVTGKSVRSDIAVDDISMTDGLCTFDCDFEFGMCDWVQDLSDDFDWRWHQGGTSTPSTGPLGDHTPDGNYIYIDTNASKNDTSARILSPWLTEGKYCFSFWYKIQGRHAGTLNVQKVDVNENTSEIIKITEQKQLLQWIQENVFIHATSGFQIIIEGTVRDKHADGDIAVDDIQMLSCQDCLMPKIANGFMSGPRNNTTYNQTVDIACEDGYYLVGNKSIICQAGGKWSAPPTCESMNSSDLTFVFVTLFLVAVALAISVTAIVCRKKILRYFAIRSPPGNVKNEHFYENQSHQHVDLSQEEENVVTADERHEIRQGETIQISTIADAAITTVIENQHAYNNTETNRVQVVDSVMKQTKGATKDCCHRYEQPVGEISEYYTLGPQSMDEKHYSVLMRDENEIKVNDGATNDGYKQQAEYYTLGPQSVDEKHYSELMKDDNDKKANDGATNNDYEQPVGATPEYFVL